MTPVERRNIKKLLIEHLKKADFTTVVCIATAIMEKAAIRELKQQNLL